MDSTVLEHASILRFIEHNWGLRPLSRRDARANDLTSAFDFAAAGAGGGDHPGVPEHEPPDREPRRWVIYLWYGAAVLLAVAADPSRGPAAGRAGAARSSRGRLSCSAPGPHRRTPPTGCPP